MPITLDGTSGITTPSYGGADTAEYLVPVTAFKNRIINGAMVIDQRNAGGSISATDGAHVVDRWRMYLNTGSGSKGNMQQNQGSVTTPTGFVNYIGFTTTSAYSVGATDGYAFQQRIEGYNIADLGWGTASAKTVTLSFWVRSSLTGTFGGSLANSNVTRSYPFSYTISSANTWEQKSITVAGDTSGTWLTTNGIGIYLSFGLGCGSSISGTAGAWAGAGYFSATGATSVVGTNGATFYITGVQLEVGSTATSFDYRPYGTELALCQRYYEVVGMILLTTVATNYQQFFWAVPKRAAPTLTLTPASGTNGAVANFSQSTLASYSGGFQTNPHSVDVNASVTGAIEL